MHPTLFQLNRSFATERGEQEANRLRLFRAPIRRGNSINDRGDIETENGGIAIHRKACEPERHLLGRVRHPVLNPPGYHPYKPVRQADDHELRWRSVRVIGCSQS